MKRIWILLLCVLLVSVFSGCGNVTEKADDMESMDMPSEQFTEDLMGQPENAAENTTGQLKENAMSTQDQEEKSVLPLSEYYIKISADGKEAVFRLYDTEAAEKLYEQLPLTLETENFRDAQWMFYPPEKLPVTADEAYHDGVKGELSYYEPWGDVFMNIRAVRGACCPLFCMRIFMPVMRCTVWVSVHQEWRFWKALTRVWQWRS